ncbi:hypothetical protein [Streptomyces sp. NBC_01264]|uniref:hypothetical protein n=1 Tax=Streptomyces sp. NBC_01264 TaxID=2903804 RepID=UPI002254E854|nr:hypothetical protein [Streptomyces sp. NBC_01264]MCX4784648.1 hypothetical protein [Streptomyces sp. NBC_01264]
MQLLDLFRRRKEDTVTDPRDIDPMPTDPMPGDVEPVPAASAALMRFLTVCRAVVEVHNYQFRTRYTYKGRPYVGETAYQVDGFRWECGGCEAHGGTHGSSGPRWDYGRYLPGERDLVRKDANGHAGECRAMPAPVAQEEGK